MKNEDKEGPLMHHDADGIKELDNLLPRWWVWLFYLTIVYSVVYMCYYHLFKAGDLQQAAYEKEDQAGETIKTAALLKFESTLDSLEPSKDSPLLENGKMIFANLCAPCHRPDGGGLVGPNLCDDYWVHGSTYSDSLKTIINGVPEKGMVSWRGLLKPNEIQAVASYIYTLRGTSPLNPKPPENVKVEEKPSEFE